MSRPTYEELEQKIRVLEQQRKQDDLESVSLFRGLAESSPSPIVLIRDHRYLFVNPAWERLTGYTREEALDFNSLDLIHPDMREIVKERREARTRGESVPNQYEIKCKGKSGNIIWLDASIALVNYQGAPAILTISNDITERRKMEKALRESQLRYKALFEDSPISLWEEDFSKVRVFFDSLAKQGVTDIRRYFDETPQAIKKCLGMIRVVDVNKATLKLYSARDKNHLLGKLSKVVPDLKDPVMKNELISMYEKGWFETEIVNYTVTGKKLRVLIHLSIPPGYEQTWEKVFVSIQDLTERYEAERERKKLEAQLQQARKMEAIGTLSGGIAHEFNNILSVILGNSELISDELADDSDGQENTEEIKKACLRGKNVVSQLLNCCHTVSQPDNATPVDLDIILKEFIKLIQSTLPAGIQVENDIRPGEFTILADIGKINDILLNLSNNAAQSMGSVSGRLVFELGRIQLTPDNPLRPPDLLPGEYIHLAVKDTGHGIEQQLLERIFDPYFTTREVGEGTGMGLPMVQGIIKEYQGGISVESIPGRGASFHIFFPPVSPSPLNNAKDIICGNRESVMLVDDEPSLLRMGEQRLIKLNYRVTIYTDVLEALEQFKKTPGAFDLVITDMTMPDLNGDEFARQLLAVRQDLPVILYTGYSEHISEASALALGIRCYLQKPIEYSHFSQAVYQVLNKK